MTDSLDGRTFFWIPFRQRFHCVYRFPVTEKINTRPLLFFNDFVEKGDLACARQFFSLHYNHYTALMVIVNRCRIQYDTPIAFVKNFVSNIEFLKIFFILILIINSIIKKLQRYIYYSIIEENFSK